MTDRKVALDALKPCPFCGGEAEKVFVKGELFSIICQPCGIFKGSSKEWNTRADIVPSGEDYLRALS